jgi:hypothetical protein
VERQRALYRTDRLEPAEMATAIFEVRFVSCSAFSVLLTQLSFYLC